ncbi:LacI family DNA-binding transcriptional regulator [Jatrophihabitans telluris]|uniref:LacI family DNA-binding transcriptional regulator n=1 Tax=Jatrophihabitans telluris TaxID=2038343 RepID=A0ABY4R321_9ACTN|nr:LacI family DNA-binding transcriptional regulator [Jatrophihabitans telluris]
MAAVSRQTVSNAVNSPHLVRADTLERVRAVIAQVGYRPHRAARTLRTRRSHLLAVPLQPPTDTIGGSVLDQFLHSLTVHAQAQDNRVLLFAAEDDDREIALYDELLDDHDVDAFVLTGTHRNDRRTEWLAGRGAVFVTFGRPWGADAHHGWVDVDGAAGTFAATMDLIERGHRRLAFLGWPDGSGVGDDRRFGFDRACAQAGISITGWRLSVVNELAAGRAAGAQLLDADEPPTAIVCVSDTLALGVWTELTARRLQPGRDVAVVGFDDTPTAAVIGLSSVAQPLNEAAMACLRMLTDVLSDPADGPPDPVLLEPRLTSRASSG